jgi:hypothetical protein
MFDILKFNQKRPPRLRKASFRMLDDLSFPWWASLVNNELAGIELFAVP